jgi:hypothetical protein
MHDIRKRITKAHKTARAEWQLTLFALRNAERILRQMQRQERRAWAKLMKEAKKS